MNTLPTEKRLAVIAAIVEGNGIRSTESMTDVHRDTIMRPVVSTGENRIALMHTWIRQVRVTRLEFDEIWTYVAKKQKRVRQEDPPEFGDQFVFVAIDPESKLVPSFAVGKRSLSDHPKPAIYGHLKTGQRRHPPGH